jgi:SAM-dependent methyltransferase
MALFTRLLDVNRRTSILDLGGAAGSWGTLEAPDRITVLNLDIRCLRGHSSCAVGDATSSPFADRTFDLVFSNSVIEHLGTSRRQQAFALEVRRLSKTGYFVQTPNKWFPIEPHYLAPFVQFLPKSIRPMAIRWATVRGWWTKPSPETCRKLCEEVRLLDAREMRRLFPEAEIVRERFWGVTKSLIAVWRKDISAPC